MEEIKEIILTMVKSITKYPDDVVLNIQEIQDAERGEVVQINIKVNTEDIPSCIGSGGSTAEAIRRVAILTGKRIRFPKSLFIRVDAPELPKNHFNFNERQ
jgi:predicted RNA-binding protein YlqC (UPF0109 family)